MDARGRVPNARYLELLNNTLGDKKIELVISGQANQLRQRHQLTLEDAFLHELPADEVYQVRLILPRDIPLRVVSKPLRYSFRLLNKKRISKLNWSLRRDAAALAAARD